MLEITKEKSETMIDMFSNCINRASFVEGEDGFQLNIQRFTCSFSSSFSSFFSFSPIPATCSVK